MRLLRFNNENIDIDDTTAIGLTLQAYDIANPGERKVATSNEFTIPKTANNMRIVGFAGNPQRTSRAVYSSMRCDYWNQNKRIINKGTARVTKVEDRISVIAFEKDNVWTQLQNYMWYDFEADFIEWLQTEKGLPSISSEFTGTFYDFINQYATASSGIVMPFLISNLSLYDPLEGEAYIENTGSLYIKYNKTLEGNIINAKGGHFCTYIKTIFEFIEYKFGIDLSVTDTETAYNIFNDAVASVMITPIRDLSIYHTETGFYFIYDNTSKFLPEETTIEKEDKTLYDLVKVYFQHFGCLIDRTTKPDGETKYIIRRFDDIVNAPVIDISGKLTGSYLFKPTVENWKQNNWIKFSGIYKGGNELTNSKYIQCKNSNIETGKASDSLFDIDAYIPIGLNVGGDVVLDISPSETFSTNMLFILSGNASTDVKSMQDGVEVTASIILPIAQLYSLASEYNVLASMMEYPELWEVKRIFSIYEIDKLAFFARYRVKELNGYFFLNSINGYNPDKAASETKIELIKLP